MYHVLLIKLREIKTISKTRTISYTSQSLVLEQSLQTAPWYFRTLWNLSNPTFSNKIRPCPRRLYYSATLLHYISIYKGLSSSEHGKDFDLVKEEKLQPQSRRERERGERIFYRIKK